MVSFDTSPEELQLFKDGFIDALIVQDPFQMGYRGVHAMDKVLKGEKVEPRVVEIPAQVVTKEKLRRSEDPGAAEPITLRSRSIACQRRATFNARRLGRVSRGLSLR